MRTIVDITNEYDTLQQAKHMDLVQLKHFIDSNSQDERKGVIKLVSRIEKKITEYNLELVRVQNMLTYERQYESKCLIGGVDEAGRGPLAGPVVAACCILNRDEPILYIDDSKKLSASKREALFEQIKERAISYGIGVVHQDVIDDINILNATYKAMTFAIDSMKIKPEVLLNDAVIIPGIDLIQVKIIHGDAVSLSIAAASILAKVTRDQIMIAYDDLYPEYGFKDHKGYGSASHIEAIRRFGPCPIHRNTFIKNFI